MNEISKHLAENVMTLRKKRGLTQSRLAEVAGATRASVALVESGSSNPTMEILVKLSRALQVSLDELMSAPQADCLLIPADEVKIETKRKGVSIRKILSEKSGPAQIDEMGLEPGAAMSGTPHVEGTREFFTCLSGEFTISVFGKSYVVRPGDVLSFPGDKPHSYKNTGRGKATGFSVVILQR